MKLNKFQKQVCLTYGGGDYAFILEPEYKDRWRECAAVAQSGDSLFQFVMFELADEGKFGTVMDRATAVQRIERAKADLDAVLWQIDRELVELK